MTRLELLRASTSLSDVAYLLGFKPPALAYVLYIMPGTAKYKSFEIPKKSGGKRQIDAPTPELCNLQKRLANLLQDCDAEIRRNLGLKRTIAHGFVRKRSIMTNAHVHLHRRFVFNTDLENFFGTINFGRVRGFFISNKHFQLNDKVATIIAQIACHNNALPQGAPTSPIISNLIGHVLDIHVSKLASDVGCTYSRYADDLSFSTNKRIFPKEIASKSDGNPHAWAAGEKLNKIIEKQGFSINEHKSRMHYADSRQEVTGLVVNRRINVKSDYRAKVRQMVHRLINTGAFVFKKVNDLGETIEQEGNIHQLGGMLSFIHAVNRYNFGRFIKKESYPKTEKIEGFKKVYSKFFWYTHFFAPELPVIMFEGKTDNIYIHCAIRSLAGSLPRLAQTDASGKTKILARLYNYTDTTKEILGLGGGSGHLLNFLNSYQGAVKKFKAPTSKIPIILVIDNDDGAKRIYSRLREVTGQKITGDESFIRVYDRIYVVPIPKILGEDTCIEDFFDESVLATKLSGKSFNKKNNIDTDNQYGKFAFAKAVIKRNEKKIDFSGFAGVLSIVDSIIAAHSA